LIVKKMGFAWLLEEIRAKEADQGADYRQER
jgi:hypothetical protein